MPSLRVERLPVKTLGLGIFGFDHLQIVYDPSPSLVAPNRSAQDHWFVIEGLREAGDGGLRLGVEGWYGATTLSEANGGAEGEDLVRRIGTPEMRGSREIAEGPEATNLWAGLVAAATDLDQQRFPYIGYAPESSALPTVNSSSLFGSLLLHVGIDPNGALPFGLRLSPGLTTLLGTSGDDTLVTGAYGISAILAGGGADRIRGSNDSATLDKLYGGAGDDAFHWSKGFNIIHGGQPGMDYAADGSDSMSYAGAGRVMITGSASARPHTTPDFTVTFAGGRDDLFSIEELIWNSENDHVVVGPNVGLWRTSLTLDLGAGDDVVDAAASDAALKLDIVAGPGDDLIEIGASAMTVSGGPGADRYVVSSKAAHFVVRDATAEDRMGLAWRAEAVHADLDRDLALDITGPAGERAQILIENFTPGALGIESLDETALLAVVRNPLATTVYGADADLSPTEIAHHP